MSIKKKATPKLKPMGAQLGMGKTKSLVRKPRPKSAALSATPEQLSNLLFAYKRLWRDYQQYRWKIEHPDNAVESYRELIQDQSDVLFQDLERAIIARKPLL